MRSSVMLAPGRLPGNEFLPNDGSIQELGRLPWYVTGMNGSGSDKEECCGHPRWSMPATDHPISDDLGTNPFLPHTPLEEVLGVY